MLLQIIAKFILYFKQNNHILQNFILQKENLIQIDQAEKLWLSIYSKFG